MDVDVVQNSCVLYLRLVRYASFSLLKYGYENKCNSSAGSASKERHCSTRKVGILLYDCDARQLVKRMQKTACPELGKKAGDG